MPNQEIKEQIESAAQQIASLSNIDNDYYRKILVPVVNSNMTVEEKKELVDYIERTFAEIGRLAKEIINTTEDMK